MKEDPKPVDPVRDIELFNNASLKGEQTHLVTANLLASTVNFSRWRYLFMPIMWRRT